jgi:hypothetical protein
MRQMILDQLRRREQGPSRSDAAVESETPPDNFAEEQGGIY